jgi:hypothetical protein
MPSSLSFWLPSRMCHPILASICLPPTVSSPHCPPPLQPHHHLRRARTTLTSLARCCPFHADDDRWDGTTTRFESWGVMGWRCS